MSNKVQNPNQGGSKNFLWAMVAIVVVAIVVVGFIVIQGQGSKAAKLGDRDYEDTSLAMEVGSDSITLTSANASADAKSVQLYEDFSCLHCSELSLATDADMKTQIEDGNLVVEIKPLNFLDRENIDGHSTHALAAALAVADSNDATLYWNFRAFLMEDQSEIYNQWSDDDFADGVEALGADSSVVDAIRNGDNIQRAYDLATANGEELTEETGSLSSPRVLQDGKDVEGNISDWITTVLAS